MSNVSPSPPPVVTIAVPSFNQASFLDKALQSLFSQSVPVEVFVMDGGSTDGSVDIIRQWEPLLAGWRSHKDQGQSAAINEGIARGSAPFVAWLNSDDWLEENALSTLIELLQANPEAPAAYGQVWNQVEVSQKKSPVWVEPFHIRRLSKRCIISQPGTLIRRSAWERIGGLNTSLHMAMDYDLWWRLYKLMGAPVSTTAFVAVNREHAATKTTTLRRRHYREAMAVVREHYGRVPIKWWLYQPYAVWYKTLLAWCKPKA